MTRLENKRYARARFATAIFSCSFAFLPVATPASASQQAWFDRILASLTELGNQASDLAAQAERKEQVAELVIRQSEDALTAAKALNPCSFVIDQTQPVDSLREYMLSPLHPTDHAAL
ncbi:MAG: hypothetical protein AB1697_10540 [Pseudomonadota bacterium]